MKIRDSQKVSNFPKGVGAPAIRALASVGVSKVEQLVKFREVQLKGLHGIGPKALGVLKAELKSKGLSLKK
ncbi:MAG: DNA-binding protein [Candidatus Dojkabacteria bacterium]